MIAKTVPRFRAALRVLAGVRLAEASFDEVDTRVAHCCAFEAADSITARFLPETDKLAEDHELCRQVARLVFEAIKRYATHETRYGPMCREQIRKEKIYRAGMEKEGASDILF